MNTKLAIPTNILDLIKARNEALELYNHATASINKAAAVCSSINNRLFPLVRMHDNFKADLDRRFWRHSMSLTGFDKYMDAVARKEFENSLERNPPEFTIENIRATFLGSYQQADLFFNRGIVNMFKRLSGEYKTNDCFKVSEKVILKGWFSSSKYFGLEVNYSFEPEMNDLDRVIKVLDGKEFIEYELPIQIRQAVKEQVFENEYFKIKMFKNGNAHLWFKRLDLLEKANEIIAEWYGENKLG